MLNIQNTCMHVFENYRDLKDQQIPVKNDLQPIHDLIRAKNIERRNARKSGRQTEQSMQENFSKHKSNLQQFKVLSKDAMHLKQEIDDAQQEYNIDQEIENEEESIAQMKQKMKEGNENIQKLQTWLNMAELNKMDIANNIQYREKRKMLKDNQTKLRVFLDEVSKVGDMELIEQQLNELESKIADNQSNINQTIGSIASEKRKAVELMNDLQDKRYLDVDERFRMQSIKYHTTGMACKDLEKFEGILDSSLIEFHSQKMKEINSVLKELWMQTYKGKDIEYIEIISERKSKSVGSGKGNRVVYNYKVVMYQGGGNVCLPMRGRCSAGQRVLASLIIRLALAETFCLKCGILALDEPTTNLDHKNIQSLAFALNEIINRRKKQENFQLILITHNEQFVEMLGQRAHADGYYRVFKDDFQHSKVKFYPFHTNSNENENNNNVE